MVYNQIKLSYYQKTFIIIKHIEMYILQYKIIFFNNLIIFVTFLYVMRHIKHRK